MSFSAFAAGCSSTELTEGERAFFKAARPCGLILFRRNCQDRRQVRSLIADVREAMDGDPLMVLVDQEGGRVRRLRPPEWRTYPSARAFASLYARDADTGLEAARLASRLLAEELRDTGITVNCTPVLDLPVPGAHDIIGDRAYGTDAETVITIGGAVAEGFKSGGVVPVMKHLPGHGRARADSHKELPVIDASLDELEATDFVPFAALRDLPAAMTAHVLLTAVDRDRPASVSPLIISKVIRDHIGFDGLLMSDDLNMSALEGSLGERAEQVIAAGCDMALHCSGSLSEMEEVARSVPELQGRSITRFNRAMAVTERCDDYDKERAEALLARVEAEQ